MPIKDTQGELSHGKMDGLPPSDFKVEVVQEKEANGSNARGGGPISTDRTSEDH